MAGSGHGIPRPAAPRVVPVEKVAIRATERAATTVMQPVNLAATLAHNRVVSKMVNDAAGVFYDPAVLDPRLRELAILRMAWRTGCEYEFGQHTFGGRGVGMSDDEIRLTTRAADEGTWSSTDEAVLDAVDDLYDDDCVGDDAWDALVAVLGAEQAIALVALAAMYRMAAGIMNSVGVQLEPDTPGWP